VKKKALASIAGVLITALISGYFLWKWLANPESLGQWGLLGVFIASLMSHITVVARDMFIPLFLPLTAIYHPVILGTSAGVGAAIGEVTTYLLGWGVAETLEENMENDNRLSRWIKRYGLWAVLLVSITPLPDTPIVLLAGSSKLPFLKLLMVECIGKTILYSLVAVVGEVVFIGITGAVGGVTASILIVAASLAFCVLVTWRKTRDLLFGWFEKFFL
jgi:membrane protein YqaA with SNARE-associated domain